MIDEKKIEEAAEKHMLEQFYSNNDWDFPCDTSDIKSQCMNDFKAGINWFLDNLWHDASEEPKEGKLIIIKVELSEEEIKYGSIDKKMFVPDLSSTKWKELCELFGYTRWLYVDDLLKGGK